MSCTDLHLCQVMWSIHRRMVNFFPFYSSLSVSIWKVYFYPARKIEKMEGGFLYLATKKDNGLGVTKIKVGGYNYTSNWAVYYKPIRFWPTKWNLSAWLPWQIYISFEWKNTYPPMFKIDSCISYDHGVCGSGGAWKYGREFCLVEDCCQHTIRWVNRNLVWVWNFKCDFSFKYLIPS